MLRFQFIPYPLWRRRGRFAPLVRAAAAPFTAAAFDGEPPFSPTALADYMARWRLLPPGHSAADAARAFAAIEPGVSAVPPTPADAPTHSGPVRLPAQWEPLESVIVAFPVLYPPLWAAHLQMIEAISAVARADVLLPAASWGRAVRWLLQTRGFAHMPNVRLLVLPTDDVWVRDYGPFVGYDDTGARVAVTATYDPLPAYPQARDDAMAARYAAAHAMPTAVLDLHTEGGNLWSDGAETLLVSDDLFARNPHLVPDRVVERLHAAFRFEKLIVTPRLWREETGHIDLLVKLASADAVLISTPPLFNNSARLRQAAAVFARETNAAGARYRIFRLPTPPAYLNWGVFPVWRSYTNALTVNGRVLVPQFGVPADTDALAVYRAALPDMTVIPIDCRATAPGGGAVHCLTKEIPIPHRPA
jgi:agmatine deiminase